MSKLPPPPPPACIWLPPTKIVPLSIFILMFDVSVGSYKNSSFDVIVDVPTAVVDTNFNADIVLC